MSLPVFDGLVLIAVRRVGEAVSIDMTYRLLNLYEQFQEVKPFAANLDHICDDIKERKGVLKMNVQKVTK